MTDYTTLDIIDLSSPGIRERKKAWLAKEYLAVSWRNKYDNRFMIFTVEGKRPVISCKFAVFEDAMKVAQMLEDEYKDFLGIYGEQDWAEQDILRIAQYSIPSNRTYVALCSLENCDTITTQDLERALKVAQ
jgi:hypothetical protein